MLNSITDMESCITCKIEPPGALRDLRQRPIPTNPFCSNPQFQWVIPRLGIGIVMAHFGITRDNQRYRGRVWFSWRRFLLYTPGICCKTYMDFNRSGPNLKTPWHVCLRKCRSWERSPITQHIYVRRQTSPQVIFSASSTSTVTISPTFKS